MDLSQSSQTGATAKPPPPKEQKKATSCAPPPKTADMRYEGPPTSQTGTTTSCAPGRMVLPPFDPAKLPPALQVPKTICRKEIQRMNKKRWYERSKTNGKYQRHVQMTRLRREVKSARKRAMNSNNRMMVNNCTKEATNPFNSLVDSADYCAAKEQNLGVDKVSEQVKSTKECGMGVNLKWFAYVAVLDMNCSKKKRNHN